MSKAPLTALIASALLASACVPYQPALPPSQWAPEFRNSYNNFSIRNTCDTLSEMNRLGVEMHDEDAAYLFGTAKKKGLSELDLKILLDPTANIAIGMTANGIECAGGRLVNDAFYSGVGHRWLMQVGNTYVHLEGNGKPAGMKVTGWN